MLALRYVAKIIAPPSDPLSGETHIKQGVPDGNQTRVYDMEDHPQGHGDVTAASADLYKFVFYFVKPNTQNHVWFDYLPPIGSPLTQSVG